MDTKRKIPREFWQIFNKINELNNKNDYILIAIDGNCASGKTTLAKLLSEKYQANVFHTDDFVIPVEMKTKCRLSSPGGNFHYERFLKEILIPLKKGNIINYCAYDCQFNHFATPRKMSRKKINIIEGVYSLHPVLQDFYDLKIFLKVKPAIQKVRLNKRSGNRNFHDFLFKWIPLEESYFTELDIESKCDFIIDTSLLF